MPERRGSVTYPAPTQVPLEDMIKAAGFRAVTENNRPVIRINGMFWG